MHWLKLHFDIIDDEKLILLSHQDRWCYIVLLVLYGKGVWGACGEDGERFVRIYAAKLGYSVQETLQLYDRLMTAGLVSQDMEPLGWDRRQHVGEDKVPSPGALRQRRYMARKASSERHSGDASSDVISDVIASNSNSSPLVLKNKKEEEKKEQDILLKDIVLKEYPRGVHNSLRGYTLHTIYQLDNVDTRQLVIDGVKRYAASIRAQGNEGTIYVMSINTFFKDEHWKGDWPLPEKKQDGPVESNDEKARRARAREMLEKMERGELDKF